MINAITLSQFQQYAEQFCAERLDAYSGELNERDRNPRRKEINDPLWGTIGLAGPEVALIDSPLFQRLRLVRQLGVVHWVYPGALHTRFEHALGVLRQVQYLCNAINSLGTHQDLGTLIDPSRVNLLRLAALLHDIGHAAFSHVSESAIDTLDGLSSISADFAQDQRIEKRSLSEVFAYYIVRSPAMRKFISILMDNDRAYINLSDNRKSNVNEIVDKISNAIVGKKIDDRLPLLHEIISGPFDADKLDYFVRDSNSAGVPSLLDISRLIQKIAIREFDAKELPGTTGRDVKAGGKHILVGIKWSGISILDELHLSRVLLYKKIYRHPKVVAIEQMVRSAILTLSGAVETVKILKLVYEHCDDELLAMSAEVLAKAVGVTLAKAAPDVQERVEKAASIFADLRRRRLVVKAFELHRKYPGDPRHDSKEQEQGLLDFKEVIDQPQDRELFRAKLIEEVERIVAMADLPKRSRTNLDGAIAIHPIGTTPGGTQIGRAWLLPSAGGPLQFRNYLVNRAAWADSYLSDQPGGYVFAEADLADAVFVAMERLLRTEHAVRLPQSALEASKREEAAIQKFKQKLTVGGYFKDAPFDIRPIPPRLADATVARTIASFVPKLESYQAPVPDVEIQISVSDSSEAVRAWLRQFDCDDDVECAQILLENLRMIDRKDTVAAVRQFVTKNPEFSGGIVVPFGDAKDSSAIHSYFAADLQGSHIDKCLSLDDAVHESGGRPIIFVDDFVGSGGQGKDILAAGFGREDLRGDLGESRNLFSNDIQKFLQQSKIGFVFTAAWSDGLEQIETMTGKIGLDAKMFCHITEADIPFAANVLGDLPPVQVSTFFERARHIGLSILEAESPLKDGQDELVWKEKLAGRALGYGNRSMLLASPFNVPTQTFTPLWARGNADGALWTPLMPRRKKT